MLQTSSPQERTKLTAPSRRRVGPGGKASALSEGLGVIALQALCKDHICMTNGMILHDRLLPVPMRSQKAGDRKLCVARCNYQPNPLPIHAVSPAIWRYSAKVNALVDFFKAELDVDPFVSAYRA